MRQVPVIIAAALLVGVGCKDKSATAPPAAPKNTTAAPKDDHGHDHGHDHANGATPVEMGSMAIGPYTVKASRDQGQIKAGGEAPIDVWVTGDSPRVVAVRFWIGAQDGAGSVKAKAEVEDPKEPNHWHTHAEVPDPMPVGAQLWVEIEDEKGGKSSGGYDLKV